MATNNVIELEKVKTAKLDIIMQIAKRFAHNEDVIEKMANKLVKTVKAQHSMENIIYGLIITNFITIMFVIALTIAFINHDHSLYGLI